MIGRLHDHLFPGTTRRQRQALWVVLLAVVSPVYVAANYLILR